MSKILNEWEEHPDPYDKYEDRYEYDDERYEDNYDKCGCRFCFCMTETEYGVTCGDCATGAHQG